MRSGHCGSVIIAGAMLLLMCGRAVSGERRGSEREPAVPVAKPSENKGKTGTYQVKTSREGCNYYVYVPQSYSDANPAGLHIFFHGQGGGGGAAGFGSFASIFCDPLNMIGINMQYMDGDNAKDTNGKVAAAMEAIAQTMADYKIIARRGVICSFSGGGLPHGALYAKYGRKGAPAASFPFIHAGLYGSNFWVRAAGGTTMSWFVGLGSEEWDMGKPTLGSSQPSRFVELLKDTAKGGCRDIYLKITKGKGHGFNDADLADSARQFRRSDLAFCPFLYAHDFPEKELRPIVASANALRLGAAASAVAPLASAAGTPEEVKKKAGVIKEKIDKRVDAVIALAKELAADDAVLCAYYAPILVKQFDGHPKQEELRKIFTDARANKSYAASLGAFASFTKSFSSFFSGPKLNDAAAPMVEKIKETAGEKSLLGKMAAEFLLMK